jgi:xanthine/uracil permease
MMESIGDITATCDVSRLQVEGDTFTDSGKVWTQAKEATGAAAIPEESK